MGKIGGDFEYNARGVYCNAMVGRDSRTRLYIGQSTNLRWRLSQHWNFRYRRDNPSLHYLALQDSKVNTFGLLCALPSSSMGNHTLPGMDSVDLLLNVLEMWMCLVFRCLPEQSLQEWLPVGVKKNSDMGFLNIASPLDQGETAREWVDLRGTGDPIVEEYVSMNQTQQVKTGSKTVVSTEGGPSAVEKAAPVLWMVSAAVLVGMGFMMGRAKMR